jgi:hypothetical protein
MTAFDYVRRLIPNPRIDEDGLYTDRGRVLDMSAAGLRIRASKRLEGTIPLAICSTAGRVSVDAHVVWTKRRGLFRFDVGLQFVNLDPATMQKITQIAVAHGYPVAQ